MVATDREGGVTEKREVLMFLGGKERTWRMRGKEMDS
jgi:hypothetical protein